MWESRKSMTEATSLQTLMCIVRWWETAGMLIIAHTQNNMSQSNGACSHQGPSGLTNASGLLQMMMIPNAKVLDHLCTSP